MGCYRSTPLTGISSRDSRLEKREEKTDRVTRGFPLRENRELAPQEKGNFRTMTKESLATLIVWSELDLTAVYFRFEFSY